MAEEDQDEKQHQSLLQKFKDEPKWVKIGAIAGVAVLGVSLLLYFKSNNSSDTTTASAPIGSASNGMSSTDHPGEGDIYPPYYGAPATGTSSPPATTTGTSSPPATTSKPNPVIGKPLRPAPPKLPPRQVAAGSAPTRTRTKSGNSYGSTNPADISLMLQRLNPNK